MDRPQTKTWSQRSLSSRSSRSTVAYQSSQLVRARSSQRVPCPGSSGSETVSPRSARYSAQGRREWGDPVKP